MHWMDLVARDPVPWLLDPGNPSVRLQTLVCVRASVTQLATEQRSPRLGTRGKPPSPLGSDAFLGAC